MKKSVRGTLVDIALNIAIPYAIYTIAHRFFGFSDIIALTMSACYPLIDIFIEFAKDHTLNFISLIVLVGTLAGIIGAVIGGDPKLVLMRESFFTFLLGIGCFVSLAYGKPLLFYFAREFVAGKDPKKRKEFNSVLEKKERYTFFRLITLVWGFVYILEFLVKLFIIYTFSISLNLIIAPLSTYCITFATIFWTFWYVRKKRRLSNK